jgi:hypothetical protein
VGGAIQAGRELANTLRQAQAAGRVVVEANPVILAARPELDPLLEPGDLIVLPKRPGEVTVVGSVLNPGSLQFQPGWGPAEYLRCRRRAAALRRHRPRLPRCCRTARRRRPASRPGARSAPPVPPGSLLVVPQDPSPFETWGLHPRRGAGARPGDDLLAALAVIARETRRTR